MIVVWIYSHVHVGSYESYIIYLLHVCITCVCMNAEIKTKYTLKLKIYICHDIYKFTFIILKSMEFKSRLGNCGLPIFSDEYHFVCAIYLYTKWISTGM